MVVMPEVQDEQDGTRQLVEPEYDEWLLLVADYVYLLTGGRKRFKHFFVPDEDLQAWYDEGLDFVQVGASIILNAMTDTTGGISKRSERR